MKTRILLLHNVMWSHYKAMVFTELNKLMEDNSRELFVIQFALTDKQRKDLGVIDFKLHNYPYTLIFNSSLDEIPWYRMIVGIFKNLKARQFDIIIIPGYAYIMCWCALLYSIMANKRVIISFDSTAMDNPKSRWKELIKRWFLSKCNCAMCYGTKAKEYLMTLGMSSNNIHVRFQATDNLNISQIHGDALLKRECDQIQANVCPHNFIYVGRLSKEKNLEILLLAYSKVKRENKRATEWGLIIVGEGPEKEALQLLAGKAGVQDVCFTGGKTWREIPKYHALSDVLVLPSLSEPWGLVVNEAMACGLPVIVSNHCGSAFDIVREGENGFTFDPKDGQDLQKKMSYFVDKPQAVRRMGEQSRRIIADYTPQNAALQMLQCIKYLDTERISS